MRIILTLLGVLFLTSCAHKGVIGVAYNKAGIVKYVFEGSNAEKAGVLLEDTILNTKELRGKPGTYIEVLIKRSSSDLGIMHFNIMRQHIDTLKNNTYGTW